MPNPSGLDQFSRVDLEKSISCITLATADEIEMWKKSNIDQLFLQDRASRPPYKRFEELNGPLNQIMVINPDGGLIDLAEHSFVVGAISTFDLLRYYYESDNDKIEKIIYDIIDGEMSNGI